MAGTWSVLPSPIRELIFVNRRSCEGGSAAADIEAGGNDVADGDDEDRC